MKVLQRMRVIESEKAMERRLKLEQYFRLESQKVQELETELKFAQAKVMALELDLERANSKLVWIQKETN